MAWIKAASAAATAIGFSKETLDQLGTVRDQVVVEVWGNGPNTPKRTLFQIAASTAFGIVKRLGPAGALIPPPGMIAVTYDAADNYLQFTLEYANTLASILAANSKTFGGLLGGPGGNPADLWLKMPVITGPDDDVVGGNWTFTGPGINYPIIGDIVLNVPQLRWRDKLILTKRPESEPPDPNAAHPVGKTLNPRPAADARSRGAWVGLVYAALTQPGVQFNMDFPDPPGDLDRFRGK